MLTRRIGSLCVSLSLLSVIIGSTSAHLGEVHELGTHDYFPDFPVTPHSVEVSNAFCVNAATDTQAVPDGSGRFLTLRSFNRLYMVQEDGSSASFSQFANKDIVGIQGSTSFEFHPDFAVPDSPGYGKIYVGAGIKEFDVEPDFVSRGGGFATYVIKELTVSDISANVFSGTTRDLMRFETAGAYHQVNDLVFDNDNLLYISVGEDNLQSNATVPYNVFGKVLRIDPLGSNSQNGKYGIPEDNPFVGTPNAAPEVYALGFRNPFRLAFDEVTEDLYAFDVGASSIEEVDLVKPSSNYGWPEKEGAFLYDTQGAIPDEPDPETGRTRAEERGYVDPVLQFDHTDGLSITGGLVYRGEEFPWLQGKVVFGAWNESSAGSYFPLYFGDPETGQVSILASGNALGVIPINVVEDAEGEILITGGSCIRRLSAPHVNSPGDANRDGVVNASDLNIVGLNWSKTGRTFAEGDFNGDGTVDAIDLNIVGTNWLQITGAPVPEPAPSWLGLLVIATFLRRRQPSPAKSTG